MRLTIVGSMLVLHAYTAIAAPVSDAPVSFKVEGQQPVLTVRAVGAQVYECKSKDGARAWAFREPIATLVQGGKTVGRHYAGPNWDVGEGGLSGKAIASVPGATPEDIPVLKLDVTAHHGTGPIADAKLVLRLHTEGGVLAGTCEHDGEFKSVPYQADYVFLK